MTVSELIDKLRAVHGDLDLRHVEIRVTISRPYAPLASVDCQVVDVFVERDEVVLTGHGAMGGI